MDKTITPEFRVSFPSVFKPTAFQDQEPKYKLTMIFPKSTDISKLKDLAGAAAKEKWGDKIPSNLRSPFRDGSEKADTEGYGPDVVFVNATSKMKPGVVDENVQDILSEEDFYAGCYARATVTAYAYSFAGNNGVAFGLQNVQKLRDGESFTGRTKPEDDFDAVAKAADEVFDNTTQPASKSVFE